MMIKTLNLFSNKDNKFQITIKRYKSVAL